MNLKENSKIGSYILATVRLGPKDHSLASLLSSVTGSSARVWPLAVTCPFAGIAKGGFGRRPAVSQSDPSVCSLRLADATALRQRAPPGANDTCAESTQ
jgi:hypothetical protein